VDLHSCVRENIRGRLCSSHFINSVCWAITRHGDCYTFETLLATDPHVVPFQPMGKPKMREWVQINLSRSEDYRQYRPVFEQSIQHVLEQ